MSKVEINCIFGSNVSKRIACGENGSLANDANAAFSIKYKINRFLPMFCPQTIIYVVKKVKTAKLK
jgi:hypothetical protein